MSLEAIRAEISNAEAFTPKLDRLYIATTAKRDAPLQKAVREISNQRHQDGRFRVNVLFWDDVCQDLAKDDHVFFTHYPQFIGGVDPVKEHDKRLFEELTKLLTSHGVIGFLDRTNMAGFSFPLSVDPLREFYYKWNNPEREFIAAELEALKKALWEKADAYLDTIAIETFPTHSPGRNTVPEEWEEEQPERFRRVVETLHSLAARLLPSTLSWCARAELISLEWLRRTPRHSKILISSAGASDGVCREHADWASVLHSVGDQVLQCRRRSCRLIV